MSKKSPQGSEELIAQGCEEQAKAMREFGYPDVTAAMIREHHKAWMTGEARPTDVIFAFSTEAFKDYPQIFGRPTP